MVTLMVTSAISQKVINNMFPIVKSNLPMEILDSTYQHYLVDIIYPDKTEFPGFKELIEAKDIISYIDIPKHIKLGGSADEESGEKFGRF